MHLLSVGSGGVKSVIIGLDDKMFWNPREFCNFTLKYIILLCFKLRFLNSKRLFDPMPSFS